MAENTSAISDLMMPTPSGPPKIPGNPSRPGERFGRYQVIRQIALGGMAQILLAIDERTGRQVVLKKMLPQYEHNPEFVKFFIHEGRLGQRLRHENLIETIETGMVEACHFIALEFLRGQTAIEVLHQASRLKTLIPLGVAVRLVADSARGLHHAHTAKDGENKPLGVVHRDVTPHNLFVCMDGSTKVLDFGIAKASSQLHQTRAGTIKGKFAYLAPEQIQAQDLDHRTDIFALGIVLHELITLRPLFRGPNEAATMQRVLQMPIPLVEDTRQDIPLGLSAVVQRALVRDRDRRIPTALALAESLEAVATAEQIPATPELVSAFVRRLFPTLDQELDPSAPLAIASVYESTEESQRKEEAPDQVRYPFFFSTSAPKLVTVDGIDVAWQPPPPPIEPSAEPSLADVEISTQAPVEGTQVMPRAELSGRIEVHAHRTHAGGMPQMPSGENNLWAPRQKSYGWVLWLPLVLLGGGAVWLWATSHTDAWQSMLKTVQTAIGWSQEAITETVATSRTTAEQMMSNQAVLQLDTEADATVLIDGETVQLGADGFYRIAPGHHIMTVSAPTLAEPRRIEFDAGERQHVEQSVRAQTGFLRIDAYRGIEVMVDQEVAGVTPLGVLEIPEGTHTIGYRPKLKAPILKHQFVVKPRKETRVRIPWGRLPTEP